MRAGISPSGPIHLGNLREVMTAHFVAEEIKGRGYDAVHLHSWDDYAGYERSRLASVTTWLSMSAAHSPLFPIPMVNSIPTPLTS